MKKPTNTLIILSIISLLASTATAEQIYPSAQKNSENPAAPSVASQLPATATTTNTTTVPVAQDVQPAMAALNPAAGAPSGDDFTINAGDVLQVTVWKEDGMDREVLVLPDGTITFPLIGTLQVQGLTPKMVQSQIKRDLKKLIPDAAVTVTVKAPLGHTVNVLGQVVKSGEIVMSRHMSVMEALSQAGGLTPYASEGNIIVIRYVDGKKTSIEFPYDDVARGRHLDKDIDLKPGDVVFVPTAGLL